MRGMIFIWHYLEKQKQADLWDEIRCDESTYLIWKWHPKGSRRGRIIAKMPLGWGSSLRVKDGEVAVFVYKQNNGIMQDFIVGPFDQTIKTTNFPVLASIIGLAYDGGTPFQAEFILSILPILFRLNSAFRSLMFMIRDF